MRHLKQILKDTTKDLKLSNKQNLITSQSGNSFEQEQGYKEIIKGLQRDLEESNACIFKQRSELDSMHEIKMKKLKDVIATQNDDLKLSHVASLQIQQKGKDDLTWKGEAEGIIENLIREKEEAQERERLTKIELDRLGIFLNDLTQSVVATKEAQADATGMLVKSMRFGDARHNRYRVQFAVRCWRINSLNSKTDISAVWKMTELLQLIAQDEHVLVAVQEMHGWAPQYRFSTCVQTPIQLH